ncbi:MAG TPA: DUF4402 domain-containing protein [Phenylobacterium sp.]
MKIIPPTSLSATSDLQFGSVKSGPASGAVSVQDSGARDASGGVTLLSAGEATAATISIADDGRAAYDLDTPKQMAIGPMTVVPRLHQTSGTRGKIIKVEASLRVPPNTPAAAYYGAFPIMAVFN